MRYIQAHWTPCFFPLFLSFLNGENPTTTLTLIAKALLFNASLPTIFRVIVTIAYLVYETAIQNWMICVLIVKHVRNIIFGVSEMIWIIMPVDFVWSQTLLYGASVLKDIHYQLNWIMTNTGSRKKITFQFKYWMGGQVKKSSIRGRFNLLSNAWNT